MRFTKMSGLGNDFIIIENHDKNEMDYSKLAIRLCNRHFGIGADGILIAEPSGIADVKMRIINSDGSETEMCGNGVRCFAKYVYERGIVKKEIISVETLSGIVMPEVILNNGFVDKVKVNMGIPTFKASMIPVNTKENDFLNETVKVNGYSIQMTSVLIGVPHTIIFVSTVDDSMALSMGPIIEKLHIFPRGTNVDFVKVDDKNNITVRTWERGAGLTLACGTGACASAVVSALNKKTTRDVYVHFAKGVLLVEWLPDNNIYMTGKAEEVFNGEIQISF